MKLTHTQAVWGMVAVAAMWSIAGVVTRQLESAARFEITFWRSFVAQRSRSLASAASVPRCGCRWSAIASR